VLVVDAELSTLLLDTDVPCVVPLEFSNGHRPSLPEAAPNLGGTVGEELRSGTVALEQPRFYSSAISATSLLSNAALQRSQRNDGEEVSAFTAVE